MRCFLGLHGVEGVVGAQAAGCLIAVQAQIIADLPVQFSIVLDDQYFEHARFLPWDGPSLSAYIKKQFNVEIGVRQCQRLFKSLGFSRIRPQPYPSKGYEDAEERVAFKKSDPISKQTTP